MELSCNKINENPQQIKQKRIYKFYPLLFPKAIKNF